MDRKAYVRVVSETDTEGKVIPIALFWEDGRRFDIDRVTEVCRAASMKAGETGMRYSCLIQNRHVFLYYEDPRWFVEAK